ncbi:hypothetical protein [Paenibacillus odorifer]|uniref:hypothetical protein n=1 Tax=Paenibacillus odorifer TaxID=189426 RepID=UPI0009D65C53|nr:hypothetical protein [Paenibacillus odorifer]
MNNPIEVEPGVMVTSEFPVNEGKSRSWRVGTLSMGLSLLFLGALIMVSQWKGADVFETTLAWWPLIFILLGLEIVIYTLWFRGKGKMYYDVLSVLFVGFLAVCCLVFAGVSSLGLTQELRHVISSTEENYSLPEWKGNVPQGVGTLIIQAAEPYGIMVDRTAGNELNVFGSYSTAEGQLKQEQEKRLLQTKQVGDTFYVILGDISRHLVFENSRNALNVTVAAPVNLKVIVRDNYGNVVTR